MKDYIDDLSATTPPPVNLAALPTPTGKIAIAGDWGKHISFARAAIKSAAQAGATVIVHVGDFGETFREDFIAAIGSSCRKHGIEQVYFVRGNHESTDFLRLHPIVGRVRPISEFITHIPDGVRWDWAGKTWLALGGAPSIDRGSRVEGQTWWPDEGLDPVIAERAIAEGSVDIVISHDAPLGAKTPFGMPVGFAGWEFEFKARAHRAVLRGVLDRLSPARWVHGHYHFRYEDTIDRTRVIGLSDNTAGSVEGNLLILGTDLSVQLPAI